MKRYEYRVVQLREGLVGGKLSDDKLEKILNREAGDGWQLKAITAADVKGRIGPGGVDGLLITFERPVG
ncbi:MAG TPA: DUF4177 domain-containing protein [Pseudonocardia sp.]|nr:DUF4177 domain-containing protein [Pseudonocardia sp.]